MSPEAAELASERPPWRELEGLFSAALALGEGERSAFLENACAGRNALHREVEAMLAVAGDEGELAVERRLLTRPASRPSPGAGQRVGRYRLLRQLGSGGMADVWLARREGASFEQQVAVKLMRPGLWNRELAARFESERQILARLSHPLIVPLLDGGLDGGFEGGVEGGQPYLVMQHVEGLPITDYCRRLGLGQPARIRLVASLCSALQYAHANLVVHRDIKPGNVLVTEDGQPRLLDFGIAKLIDPEHGSRAATCPHLQWLTPERAAPEQLHGGTVTAATDIYALGVLLYELITGRLPERPGAAADTGSRGSARVRRGPLRGDLRRIVERALDGDPERRYASAGQLGDDLERLLAGRPVRAVPDRWAYRARRFLTRHWPTASALALTLALLAGSALAATLQARRVAAAHGRADAEARKAKEVVEMLIGVFDLSGPGASAEADSLPVGVLLAYAAERIEALRDQPETRARMRLVLGRIHLARSRFAEARVLFERSWAEWTAVAGADHPLALELQNQQARALEEVSRRAEARDLLEDLLPRQQRVLGADHPDVVRTMALLARLTEGAHSRALAGGALAIERARPTPHPPTLVRALAAVAREHQWAGDRATAANLYREAADLLVASEGEEHPDTQTVLASLAGTLDDLAEKEALYRRLIVIARRVFGPDSYAEGNRLSLLGETLAQRGVLDEAELRLREARAVWTRIGGPDHWRAAVAGLYLAPVAEARGRPDEALALARWAHRTFVSGNGHPRMAAAAASQLARLLLRQGHLDEALSLARQGRDLQAAVGGHPRVGDGHLTFGLALLAEGDAAAAESELALAVDQREALLPATHPRLGEARCALARAWASRGRQREAAALAAGAAEPFAAWPLADPQEVAACQALVRTAG